jgi:hypothetical protein
MLKNTKDAKQEAQRRRHAESICGYENYYIREFHCTNDSANGHI